MICSAPGIDKREKYTLFKPEALAKRTGLAYIPLYSPSAKPKLESFDSVTITPPDSLIGREYNVFTEDSDSGESSDDGMFYGSFVPKRTATNISELLKIPEHPSRMSNHHQKNVGSILISIEFWEKLQKQEKQKLEKANEKRQKKFEQTRKREHRDKIVKLKRTLGKKKHPAGLKKINSRKCKLTNTLMLL